MRNTSSSVRQIIPAVGWYAVYYIDLMIDFVPLAAWALWNDSDIAGMISDSGMIVEANSLNKFLGYTNDPRGELGFWEERAAERRKEASSKE
jgi:hypothetical protein